MLLKVWCEVMKNYGGLVDTNLEVLGKAFIKLRSQIQEGANLEKSIIARRRSEHRISKARKSLTYFLFEDLKEI